MSTDVPGLEVQHAQRFIGLPVTSATDKLAAAYMDSDGGLAIDFVRNGEPARIYLDPDSGRWLAAMTAAWHQAHKGEK